ncbi:MAG: hypothetical protein WC414_00510 [Patescibacteria group bacterium]
MTDQIIRPKVIFIDWYKTLSNSLFWDNSIYFSSFREFLFINNRPLLDSWMRGEYTYLDIAKILSEKFSISFTDILSDLEYSSKNMKFVSEDIPILLNKIRNKGIKVVLASDNMDTFRKFTMPAMNLEKMFDDFLLSPEIKALKKDIKDDSLVFFAKYFEKNNLLYNEAILIDDNDEHAEIYLQKGFKIEKINNVSELLARLNFYAN